MSERKRIAQDFISKTVAAIADNFVESTWQNSLRSVMAAGEALSSGDYVMCMNLCKDALRHSNLTNNRVYFEIEMSIRDIQ